ncbi:MAG TPA: biotin/lipoyl-containing protein, partial [Desulfuromonadaceae bacterium]
MEIRVPEVGESVREALLAKWFKKAGERVKKDEALCELETDKITLDINADVGGVLSIAVAEGTTVPVGTVIGTIDEQAAASAVPVEAASATATPPAHEAEITASVSSPTVRREMREQGIVPDAVTGTGKGGRITLDDLFSRIEETSRRAAAPKPAEAAQAEQAALPLGPSQQPAAAAPHAV